MISEEIIQKRSEDSFQEIEIQENSRENRVGYFQPDNYNPKSSNFPNDPMVPYTAEIIPISERDVKFNQVIHFGRFFKWVCVIEFLMIFTYLIIGAIFLLVLLFTPVLGFIGAKKLNRCLSVFYLGYVLLSILLRLILVVAYGNIAFIVVGSLVIVSNLVGIRYVISFIKVLRMLNFQEKKELLILQNGVPNRNNDILKSQNHYDNKV